MMPAPLIAPNSTACKQILRQCNGMNEILSNAIPEAAVLLKT